MATCTATAATITDVVRLPPNPGGRDLIIGDIHGRFSWVERELARIGFDPGRDRLICCGDLIDRGPESPLALEWLARPWFYSVLGNHDASLLQRFGVLSSKFELWHDHLGWLENLDRARQRRLVAALAALPWALELETAAGLVGVVHAEVPRRFGHWREFIAALADEEVRSLAVSNRTLAREASDLGTPGIESEQRLEGVAWLVHGHTPRPGCRVGQLGNRLWIDTMGWYDQEVARGAPRFTLIDAREPWRPL